MRTRRLLIRSGVIAAALGACIVAIPRSAAADPMGPVCSDDTCEVGVQNPGSDSDIDVEPDAGGEDAPPAGGGADTSPFADCTFTVVETDAKTHPLAGDRPKGKYSLVVETCTSEAGESIKRAQWVAEGADGQVRIDPALLAQQAVDRLTLPRPVIEASPESTQLVNLPTWLAVSEASWQVQTATASLSDQTATATATPVEAVWDLGDGHTETCFDRGAEWVRGTDPKAESECGHTYTQPSAQALDVQVTVTWRITWEVVWPGNAVSETAPDMTTIRTDSWLVTESHALVTR